MQYTDRQNAFQREAANMAIRQRVVGAHADDVASNNGENAEVPIPPAQSYGNFMFLLEQEQEQGQEQDKNRDKNNTLDPTTTIIRMTKFLQHMIILEQCPFPFLNLETAKRGVLCMRWLVKMQRR